MVLHSDPTPQGNKPKSRKVAGSLLALGAAAVVSVYTIGYTQTQASIDDLTAQLPVPTVVSQAVANSAGGTAAKPTAVATSTVRSGYVDGSYTGTGTSRHGNITATVVISGCKITSASVTNCATRYPCSDVDPLVSAVVSNQSVPTSNVSGATDSAKAYKTAVTNALQKALVAV